MRVLERVSSEGVPPPGSRVGGSSFLMIVITRDPRVELEISLPRFVPVPIEDFTMMRNCDSCGTAYIAQRSTSRFCSSVCRRRNGGAPAPPRPPQARSEASAALLAVTRAELQAAGMLKSVLGQAALKLAEALGNPDETAGGVAALSRELRATMAAVLQCAPAARDPLDELKQRRDRKRGSR
jgi:hypothetical protein